MPTIRRAARSAPCFLAARGAGVVGVEEQADEPGDWSPDPSSGSRRPLPSAPREAPPDSVPHSPTLQPSRCSHRKFCQLPPGKARASGKRHSENANPAITCKMDSSP